MKKVSKKFLAIFVVSMCLTLLLPMNVSASSNTNFCSANWKKVFSANSTFEKNSGATNVTKKTTQKKFQQLIEEGCSFKIVLKRSSGVNSTFDSYECAYIGMAITKEPNPYLTCISAGALELVDGGRKIYSITLDFLKEGISFFWSTSYEGVDSVDFSIFVKK